MSKSTRTTEVDTRPRGMTAKHLDDTPATPTDTPEGLALLAFLRGVPLRDAITGNGTTLEDLEETIREAFQRALDPDARRPAPSSRFHDALRQIAHHTQRELHAHHPRRL